MSLNKLLCKYLDTGDEWSKEGKGYVTIGDLVTAAGILACPLLILAMYIQGAIIAMEDHTAGVLTWENYTTVEACCIMVCAAGTMFIVAAVGATILYLGLICIIAVWGVKIAKCERKEGDETDGST